MPRARGIRARLALVLYLAGVFAASALTDWKVLAGVMAAVLLVFFRDVTAVFRRALLFVAPFVVVTSAAGLGYIWWTEGGIGRADTVSAFALRTTLLAFMTFLFVRRVDLFEALSFSKTLLGILIVSMAQIQIHRRILDEFPDVIRSRTAARPGAAGTLRAAAVISGSVLGQSIAQGRETGEAMRSRST